MKFKKASPLKGEVHIPGDKSISHRSVMFGSIAKGTTQISHFLQGADCLSTISCFQKMGVAIENNGDSVIVRGNGLRGLKRPDTVLDCGNSGTTTRLISGILSAQNFDVTVTGDESIQKRPMKRIIEPLSLMGAQIESLRQNGCAPLHITGRPLQAIHYHSRIPSAQVKSAILLAGLYADGETRVTETHVSRNHSELMLRSFGADVRCEGTTAIIPTLIDELPMIAVMACFAEGTTIIKDAAELKVKESNRLEVMVKNLSAMGADVTETADGMIIRGGKPLHGAVIDSLLDHRIAMTFAVAGLCAEGETEILGAECVNISYPGFYEDLMKLMR